MKPIRLFAALDPSALVFDEATRTIRNVVVSTGDANRNGWKANSTAIDLTQYKANPILLWNHEGHGAGVDPDVVIGTTGLSVRVEGDKIVADLTFEDAHINPLAEKVYRKMLAKTIRSTSIYLNPSKTHLEDGPDGVILVVDQAELLEISVVIIPANPAATVQAAIDTLRPQWAKEDEMHKVLLAALGLPENADANAAKLAIEHLQASQKVLKDATGKDSPAEAAGVVAAWKAGAEQAQAAMAKLAEVEKAAAEKARTELIEAGLKAGKILPAQEAWARSCPTETLKAFLDVAQSQIPPKVEQPKTVAAGASKPWSEMTTMEKHRLANDDPETFAALKAQG